MRYFDDWEDDYYTQHEQLLIEMCNCYGVDEDDVMMLLEYGYTCDEIEDMLCDYSLIILLELSSMRKIMMIFSVKYN